MADLELSTAGNGASSKKDDICRILSLDGGGARAFIRSACFAGEGLSLLEKGLVCTLPNRNRKAGLAPWPAGSIPMERLSAPERTREELRALMNGDLGTAAGRGDLVRLALRLIVEEALEGEVADVLGRERYERGDGEKAGYRNGYRPGKVKTAEGAVDYRRPGPGHARAVHLRRTGRAFGAHAGA